MILFAIEFELIIINFLFRGELDSGHDRTKLPWGRMQPLQRCQMQCRSIQKRPFKQQR
jgi:hypothetical protein